MPFETNEKRNLRFKDGFVFALCPAFQRFALLAGGRDEIKLQEQDSVRA
jgi:hypothetical protein